MRLRFLSLAKKELDEAVMYYDHQLPGLGFRFFQEISSGVQRIQFMPDAWTKVGDQTRRCLLKSFPYAIYYVIESDQIIVTAVAHLHRDPEYYRTRMK